MTVMNPKSNMNSFEALRKKVLAVIIKEQRRESYREAAKPIWWPTGVVFRNLSRMSKDLMLCAEAIRFALIIFPNSMLL